MAAVFLKSLHFEFWALALKPLYFRQRWFLIFFFFTVLSENEWNEMQLNEMKNAFIIKIGNLKSSLQLYLGADLRERTVSSYFSWWFLI